MSNARDNILRSLRNNAESTMRSDSHLSPPLAMVDGSALDTLKASLAGTGTQVHDASAQTWPSLCADILRKKGIGRLLYSAGTSIGAKLEKAFSSTATPTLVPWQDGGSLADKLWSIEASITSARAGIALTGSLMISSSTEEPRVMSLVPPIHIALLDAAKIYRTLDQMLAAEFPAHSTPANSVLISGPSKTADIEGRIVHGIHGPKELIVIICQ